MTTRGGEAIMATPAEKLAEILALATDIEWSAYFSDRQDSVNVYAKTARLPGTTALHFELQTPETWRVRPSTTSLQREEAEFWQRFSIRDGDPFGGFEIATADLGAVLPAEQLATVLDGLRSIAARREATAFQNARSARDFRAVIQKYDRGWACPVRVADGQFEDSGHILRVERLQEHIDWCPPGCWMLREVDRYPRRWTLPGWWATRRAADDEARHVLASKAAGAAARE